MYVFKMNECCLVPIANEQFFQLHIYHGIFIERKWI